MAAGPVPGSREGPACSGGGWGLRAGHRRAGGAGRTVLLEELEELLGGVGMSLVWSPACSLTICLVLVLSTLKVTASPAVRSFRAASPFLSRSLALVAAYSVVAVAVLMVTELAPTAVTVPV